MEFHLRDRLAYNAEKGLQTLGILLFIFTSILLPVNTLATYGVHVYMGI